MCVRAVCEMGPRGLVRSGAMADTRGTLITSGLASIGLAVMLGIAAAWMGAGFAGVAQSASQRASSGSMRMRRGVTMVPLLLGAGTVVCGLGSLYLFGVGCRMLVMRPAHEE